MTTILKSIIKLNPDTQVTVLDNDIDRIKWSDGNPTNITKEQILAKQTELQADYDAKQYQRDRVYPSIGDQLDMQYKDLLNGTTTWKDAVAKVKSDNPKN
jgi:hypothetical protein